MLSETEKYILRVKDDEISRLAAQNSALQTALDTVTVDYRDLANDNRRLTEQLRRMQDLLSANQDMNLRLATMNEDLAARAQDLATMAQALQAERNAFERECIRLRKTNAEQLATIREVSATLNAGNRQQAAAIKATIADIQALAQALRQ